MVPGRTPFVVEDLLSLKPEVAFLGHGHGDHADNAAWLGSKLGIPVFASAETCADLNTLDMPALITSGALPSGATLDCRDVTTFGSHPGAEIVKIDVMEPVASITAFRHFRHGVSRDELPDHSGEERRRPARPRHVPAGRGALVPDPWADRRPDQHLLSLRRARR
jgi:hypothetical protein